MRSLAPAMDGAAAAVSVAGFESVAERDGGRTTWLPYDTFYTVEYRESRRPPAKVHRSRHLFSEFATLRRQLAHVDAVDALPFPPSALENDVHSEAEVRARQQQLNEFLRGVLGAVDPSGTSPGSAVLMDFLRGELQRDRSSAELRTNQPEPEPEPEPQPEPEPEPSVESSRVEEDDEEEVVCRICRMEGEDDWPLFFPCKCSGSIKYVHQDCLQTWMKHSKITSCELCKHPFDFTPIYSPDTPTMLPPHELLRGLLGRMRGSMRFLGRLVVVICVWLVFIPATTCWISRFFLLRNPIEQSAISISEYRLTSLPGDCVYGAFLSVAIVLVLVGIASLRDFVLNGDEEWEEFPPQDADPQAAQAEARPAGEAAGEGGADRAQPAAAEGDEAGFAMGFDIGIGDEMGLDADGQEIPFDELVGMTGPLQHLIENVLTVLCSNAIFMALFCWLPFNLGRAFLMIRWDALSSWPQVIWQAARNQTEVSTLELAAGHLLSDEEHSDHITVGAGYFFIFCVCAVWMTVCVSLRSRCPWLHTPMMGHIMDAIEHVYIFLKVAFLLSVELGVFPMCTGCWLDICTLGLVDAKFSDRADALKEAPAMFLALHWLVGIIYMLYISLFVSLLRETLRPQLFWFLRDPDDPDFHPFRDLVEESLCRHARRVVLSAMIYAPLIVMLIWTPVNICRALSDVLPLNVQFRDPYTEVPADIILFHVCVPFTMEHFHPRDTVKRCVRYWATTVGAKLRMTHYAIPAADMSQEEWAVLGVTKEQGVQLCQPEPEPEPEPEAEPEPEPEPEPES